MYVSQHMILQAVAALDELLLLLLPDDIELRTTIARLEELLQRRDEVGSQPLRQKRAREEQADELPSTDTAKRQRIGEQQRGSRELLALVDMEVCRRADRFIGNSVSNFSAWLLVQRAQQDRRVDRLTGAPVVLGMRRPCIRNRLLRTSSSIRTRIGIWRSPVLNLAVLLSVSPRVAMRMVVASAAAVTPISAASSGRGVTWISGRNSDARLSAFSTSGRSLIWRATVAAAAASKVGSLLSRASALQAVRAVGNLFEARPGTEHDSWLELDAKVGPAAYATDAAPPKLPAAETPLDAIVFHVGAGSYLEHHALQRAFAEGPRTVCYGAADLADPTAFLEEIMELGA